jgi:hypothetical protein
LDGDIDKRLLFDAGEVQGELHLRGKPGYFGKIVLLRAGRQARFSVFSPSAKRGAPNIRGPSVSSVHANAAVFNIAKRGALSSRRVALKLAYFRNRTT